jgi:AraC-like DNA-binding protein
MTPSSPTLPAPLAALEAQLAACIARHSAGRGSCDLPTAIDGLSFFRRESPTPPSVCLVEPSAIFVVQGEKRMWLGGKAYPYNPGHLLITSLDIPASSEVVSASAERPCLGLVIRLDLRTMAELIAHGSLPPPRMPATEHCMGLGAVSADLLEPCRRLLALLDEPASIAVLAPLVLREIHYRLLVSEQAAHVRQTASAGSQSHRIARAIDWIKANFSLPLSIDELAGRAQMSSSTLHHHFRQLTGMSPLQYQKWMRLNEARRLMLSERLDAASSAFRVGYESPSQFSREYSRLFGAPPRRDIEQLRHGPGTATENLMG